MTRWGVALVAGSASVFACGITLEVRPGGDHADASTSSSSGTVDGSSPRDATTSSSGGTSSSSSSGAACATQIDRPTACADTICGKANDGCQGTYDCDDHCATDESPNALCVPGTNTCTCQQSECPGEYQCGDAPSGCGGPRSCGQCSEVADCNGERHVCECKLYSCGVNCGQYHGCNVDQLGCECNGPSRCIESNDNAFKVCCLPFDFNTACGGAPFANEVTCRVRIDGCGDVYDCGQCAANQHCQYGTPNTCVPN